MQSLTGNLFLYLAVSDPAAKIRVTFEFENPPPPRLITLYVNAPYKQFIYKVLTCKNRISSINLVSTSELHTEQGNFELETIA